MLSHLKHLPNFSVNAVLVRGYRFWDCFTMSGLTSARGMLAMWGESCVLSLLVRTHGGARRVERRGTPKPFRARQAEDPEAKAAIARAASELIADDDAVIFDNGTTVQAIAQRLAGRPITAMCLSLHSAAALGAKRERISLCRVGRSNRTRWRCPASRWRAPCGNFAQTWWCWGGRVRRRWNTGWRRQRMTMRRINAPRCARQRDASCCGAAQA